MQTPMGNLTLAHDEHGLAGVSFADEQFSLSPPPNWTRDDSALRPAADQLADYFLGKRMTFGLPLSICGTPFQKRVWQALVEIPYGTTMGYGELARRIGAPGSARAVGGANGSNPLAIIVPCHRVIGADGSLTGYGGGEDRKRWLLEFERAVVSAQHAQRPPPLTACRSAKTSKRDENRPQMTFDF